MSDTDLSHQLAMDCKRVIKVGENSEEPTPRHRGVYPNRRFGGRL